MIEKYCTVFGINIHYLFLENVRIIRVRQNYLKE